jgi:hypothetical protein
MLKFTSKLIALASFLLLFGLHSTGWTQDAALSISTPFEITSLAWHPDGTRLAVGTSEGLKLYDETLHLIQQITKFNDAVSAVAWSPDGKQLATGSWYKDGRTQIWDYERSADTFKLQQTLEKEYPDYYGVSALGWSPDGAKLAEVGEDTYLVITGHVAVYDTTTWDSGKTITIEQQLNKVVWNPVSDKLAVAGKPSSAFVYIVDAVTMESEHIQESTLPYLVLEWTASNQLILGTQVGLAIVDVLVARLVNVFTLDGAVPTYRVSAWNETQDALAYVSLDKLKIWNIQTNAELFNYVIKTAPVALDWSSKDKIALAGYDTLEIVDVSSLSHLSEIATVTPLPSRTPIRTDN